MTDITSPPDLSDLTPQEVPMTDSTSSKTLRGKLSGTTSTIARRLGNKVPPKEDLIDGAMSVASGAKKRLGRGATTAADKARSSTRNERLTAAGVAVVVYVLVRVARRRRK